MKPHILVVDDEKANLKIFKLAFKRDYTISLANSAQEGLQLLERESVDLIISDFRMPIMNGVEFLNLVNQKKPHIPKMLLSGSFDIEHEYPTIPYILAQKPWNKQSLKQKINHYLNY